MQYQALLLYSRVYPRERAKILQGSLDSGLFTGADFFSAWRISRRCIKHVLAGILGDSHPRRNKLTHWAAADIINKCLDTTALGMPQHDDMLHLEGVRTANSSAALVP